MATSYIPNASDATQPTVDKYVESAAAEFRAIKARVNAINDRLGFVETTYDNSIDSNTGGGTGTSVTHANVVAALASEETRIEYTRTTPWSGAQSSDSIMVVRNANYSGGGVDAYGNRSVGSAITAVTMAGAQSSNCEMTLRGIVVSDANVSPGAQPAGALWPQNVGLVGQAFQRGTAPVWGAWIVAQNISGRGQVPGEGAIVAMEVQVGIKGVDTIRSSLGIDIVPMSLDGSLTNAFCAARASGSANITWQYGFKVDTATAASFHSSAFGERGLHLEGNYIVGIDVSGATFTNNTAIRLKSDSYIAFDQYDQFKMKLNPSNNCLEFYNATTRHGYINLNSGADADLASGGGGGGGVPSNMVTTDSNQTIGGVKIFSEFLFIAKDKTLALSSQGNVRQVTSGVSTAQLRIAIDLVPYYIPIYPA